jgi:hypothetical protein
MKSMHFLPVSSILFATPFAYVVLILNPRAAKVWLPEVSEHLEESLKSENFPQICIHRNLENFCPHDGRFKRTPNKIWLLAEVSGVPHSP